MSEQTPVTINHLDSILKEFYIGPIQEQLNNEVMVLQMFEKAKISWAGKQGVVPVHVDRNVGGVAFKTDGGDLPTAGSQEPKRLTFTAAYLYGRFAVTGPAIAAAAKGGTASFIGALELEMDKLKDDIRNKADRTVVSGGRVAGFLNERKNETGASVWQFRGDFQKIADAWDAKGSNIDVEVIDCSNKTITGKSVTYEKITTPASIDVTNSEFNPTAGTIHLTGALDTTGVAAGFGCALVISDTDAGVNALLDQEPIGIYGNLGSESHFGVDRGSVAGDATVLQSIIMTADLAATSDEPTSDAALTLSRMQEVIDSVNSLSGMEPSIILMNPGDRAKYIALCQGQLQITRTGTATNGDAGFLGLSYGGFHIKAASHVDRGLMLFLNTKDWKLAVLEDFKFADLDGNVLSRVNNKDSFEGFCKWYYNHYCCRPNANAVLTGIQL